MATIRQLIKELKTNKLVRHDPIARENRYGIIEIRSIIESIDRVAWDKESALTRASVLSDLGAIRAFCQKSIAEFPDPCTPRQFPTAIFDAIKSARNHVSMVLLGKAISQMFDNGRKNREEFQQIRERLENGAKTTNLKETERESDTPESAREKTVFVSYSWSSDEHRRKVDDLVERLKTNRVHVIRDVEVLKPGQDIFASWSAS